MADDHTSRDSAQNRETGPGPMIHVGEPTDHGVKQDHKDCPQSRDEEKGLLVLGPLLRSHIAQRTDQVEHSKCRQTQRRIEIRSRQAFQRVDDDSVCWRTRRRYCDSHQRWDLASSDVDSRASHEGGNGSERDEVDEPAKADET